MSDYVVPLTARLRLTGHEVRALTKVLALPPERGTARPAEAWLAQQAELVPKLPLYLRSWDLGFITRLWHSRRTARHLRMKEKEDFDGGGTSKGGSNYAILCPAHARLDHTIVRRLFLLVVAEVTTHAERISLPAAEDGEDGYHRKRPGPEVAAWAARVRAVNGLWMTESQCAVLLGMRNLDPLDGRRDTECRLPRVESHCEACVLAAVGARPQVLVDLAASLKSRVKRGYKGRRYPPLLKIVEAWMDHFEGAQARGMRKEAEALGRKLRRVRRAEQKKRRERRKSLKSLEGKVPFRRADCVGWEEATSWGDRMLAEPRVAGRSLQDEAEGQQEMPSPSFLDQHRTTVFSDQYSLDNNKNNAFGFQETGDHQGLTSDEWAQLMAHDIDDDNGGYNCDDHLRHGTHEPQTPIDDQNLEASICQWYQRSAPMDEKGESCLDLVSDMHPAFRSFVAPSAVPEPLHLRPSKRGKKDGDAKSWVSCTVHTFGDDEDRAESDAPPVPAIPSKYQYVSVAQGLGSTNNHAKGKGKVNGPARATMYRSQHPYAASSIYSNELPSRGFLFSPPTTIDDTEQSSLNLSLDTRVSAGEYAAAAQEMQEVFGMADEECSDDDEEGSETARESDLADDDDDYGKGEEDSRSAAAEVPLSALGLEDGEDMIRPDDSASCVAVRLAGPGAAVAGEGGGNGAMGVRFVEGLSEADGNYFANSAGCDHRVAQWLGVPNLKETDPACEREVWAGNWR